MAPSSAKLLAETQSLFQPIAVYQHPEFGYQLYLDSSLICSTKNTDYFNALAEPIACKPDLKQVLILGGGHGMTAQALLNKRDSNNIDAASETNVTLVEIDIDVIRLCKTHFDKESQKIYQHPQVNIIVGDAFTMIKHQRRLGAVILDISLRSDNESDLADYLDGLFKNLRKSLKPSGVFSLKLSAPIFTPTSEENVALIQTIAGAHFESLNLQWLTLTSMPYPVGILSGCKASETP